MNAKEIGQRIHLLINEHKITAKELSKNTGIRESALTGYKKGEYAPSAEAIINISEFFSVSTDWLLMGKGKMKKDQSELIDQPRIVVVSAPKEMCVDERSLINTYRDMTINGKEAMLNISKEIWSDYKKKQEIQPVEDTIHEVDDTDLIEIKVFDLPASAGLGSFVYDDHPTYELIDFDADEVPPQADFAIRITGVSMEPVICEGDIVFVKSQPSLDDQDIGIFVINNEAFCKRVNNDKKRLDSINPKSKHIYISGDDNVRIIGKVLI